MVECHLQILLRLHSSFKGSFLELSRPTLYTLGALISLIWISCIAALIVDDYDHDCIHQWNAPDLDYTLTYCVVPSSELIVFRFWVFQSAVLVINGLNITFGIMFTLRLRRFVQMGDQSPDARKQRARFKIEALIVKNDILCVIGCISTSTGYLLWTFTFNMMFLYCDLFVNTLCIGLMFSVNEVHYKRLCRPCILLWFWRCHHFEAETELARQASRRVLRYVDRVGSVTERDESIQVTPTSPSSVA